MSLEIRNIYMSEFVDLPVLTREEEVELFKRYEKGDELAKEKLVEHNLKWVVSLAQKHIPKGMSEMDLIQEGSVGLLKAIENFDYKMGNKFSTYATHWIEPMMIGAIKDKSRAIRIPRNSFDNMIKISYRYSELIKDNTHDKTIGIISRELDIDKYRVEELYLHNMPITSLNMCLEDSDDLELINLLKSDELDPISSVLHEDLIKDLIEAMERLVPQERKAIKLLYGLGGEKRLSRNQVAERFGVTTQRVSQIEGMALRKLRHPKFGKILKEYLTN